MVSRAVAEVHKGRSMRWFLEQIERASVPLYSDRSKGATALLEQKVS